MDSTLTLYFIFKHYNPSFLKTLTSLVHLLVCCRTMVSVRWNHHFALLSFSWVSNNRTLLLVGSYVLSSLLICSLLQMTVLHGFIFPEFSNVSQLICLRWWHYYLHNWIKLIWRNPLEIHQISFTHLTYSLRSFSKYFILYKDSFLFINRILSLATYLMISICILPSFLHHTWCLKFL